MVPVIVVEHIYQPPSVMAPTGIQKGFKWTSVFVPKVVVQVRGLNLQQSSLSIMSKDFMDVVAGNVAFQNSRGPAVAGAAI